ncbi:MAG: EAL domain-containing protein [Pseudomonadota bacterium]
MSISARINLLITALAILAGLVLTVFVGQRDFAYQRDAVTLAASSLVGSQPRLSLSLYFRDEAEIDGTLREALDLSPAITQVTLHDSQGAVLAGRTRDGEPFAVPPTLESLRRDLAPLERGLVWREGGNAAAELEILRRANPRERTLYLTIPVVSVVNPQDQELSREGFASALTFPEQVSSLYVVGYLNVAISSTLLWNLSLPTIALSAGFGLFIVFLFWLIARITTRRIMAPLGELAKSADEIVAGRQTQTLPLRGSGEVRDIAEVFNGIITGLHQYTKRMDTDRQILSLKVDERTQQLSEKQQALTQANRSVSEAQDRARHLAYFDSLTSLPNRRLFREQLTLMLRLARRGQQRLGLLLVDIDNFKRVNDSLGPGAGDRLLKAVSERLADGVRDSDVLHRGAERDSAIMDLSRMGGDEFTVVLNNLESTDAAMLVAERLRNSIAAPLDIDDQEVIVTCSIGIALFPDDGAEVEALMGAAAAAMGSAKERGKNRVVIYDSEMEAANRERLQLETDLRKAVERDQLVLYYQPQVNAETGEVCGAESLVRWQHPEHGMIPPFKWIPIAEDLGLIEDVGDWVLRQACRDLHQLRKDGFDLPMLSVNVSPLQLNDEFILRLSDVLGDFGISPESLELELTEGILVDDQENTLERVNKLKALGVRLSVDDFGTGYSSLNYLTRLPLNEIKIDRSFVLGLSLGGANVELLRAIIAMAKSLNLDIVVEGVERIPELEFFRKQSAHVIQGFLFSPPVPMAKLRAVLAPGYFSKRLTRLYQENMDGELDMHKA